MSNVTSLSLFDKIIEQLIGGNSDYHNVDKVEQHSNHDQSLESGSRLETGVM